MGNTQKTFIRNYPYEYPKNTLTLSEIKDVFLTRRTFQKVVKEKIKEYEGYQEELNTRTKERLLHLQSLFSGEYLALWVYIEKIRHTETTNNIQRHIQRLKRFLYIDTKSKSFLTEETIDRARNHPMQDLVSSYGIKVIRGTFLCPFHNDTNPSASIHKKTNRFKCFSCGAGGDTIQFVRLLEGISFPDAVKKLI
jgi:hypothetical protein